MENKAANLNSWLQTIAQLITSALSLLLIIQVYLAKEQIKLGIRWNKLSATFTFFTNDTFVKIELPAAEMLKALGVDLYRRREPLDDTTVKAILEDPDKFKEIKAWLNLLEDYATAVHVGVLEPDSSFDLMADVIIRNFQIFKPIIDCIREEMNNIRVWIELEKLALKWETRQQREIIDLEEQLKQARARYKKDHEELLRKQGANKRF